MGVREHGVTLRAVIIGVSIAFANAISSFVIGMVQGFSGWIAGPHWQVLSLVLCFAIFFVGGRFGGQEAFWPAVIAYVCLAVLSAVAVTAIVSGEFIVVFGVLPLLLKFVVAIVAFKAGVGSWRTNSVTGNAPQQGAAADV